VPDLILCILKPSEKSNAKGNNDVFILAQAYFKTEFNNRGIVGGSFQNLGLLPLLFKTNSFIFYSPFK